MEFDAYLESLGNTLFSEAVGKAYSALFEDAEGNAAHKTRNLIRKMFPNLAGKFDRIAIGENGKPILTANGKEQKFIDLFERRVRNEFFHDGANIRFEPGVARIAYGELHMEGRNEDSNRISKLKKIIKLISDGHADEYDANLNGMSFDELERRFGTTIQKADDRQMSELAGMEYKKSDYKIELIPDFNAAQQFSKYTNPNSRWCITYMENMWDTYTSNGMSKVYFAYRPGFEKLKPIKRKNCPLDEYGLSLISIIVDPRGNLRAVTTRWNHGNGGSDQAMNAKQLSELLGGNVFELCPPPPKPEQHIDRVDADSVRIGDQIWMSHNLQMPTDPDNGIYVVNGETYFTWEAAKRVAERYGNGWRLPSSEDWKKLSAFCGGGSKAGIHLKSTSGWKGENGFDTYGFDGKPVGHIYPGGSKLCNVGTIGCFWSSNVGECGHDMNLFCDGDYFIESYAPKEAGCPVRLVKDSA